MIAQKHITKIVAAIMAVAVCLCLLAPGALSASDADTDTGFTMEYESELFDTSSPIQINIIMDEENWQNMLDTAIEETYQQCDIEVNGQMFYGAGIRPKGNTSLTSIVNDPTTDRYSFKVEFDHYVDGQTCFGLDKLILNNNFADATNMKEALVYDMFQYLGADASLYNYAEISVNGEYWGVYLALEAVEDSFLLRNYGAEAGELYKPDGMSFGNMSKPEGRMPQFDGGMPESNGENLDAESPPDFESMAGMIPSDGANLNYIDDDLDSYSTIWDCEITDTTAEDHRRVVTALQNIAEGTDLETYMDVDNLLRYMAVHVFSVNEDSLSGMMAHNYYLYEHNGRLNILPWDYNLALGGMIGQNNAESTINDAIDTPFNATNFFDKLLENEDYRTQYHTYLQQLVDKYVNGGGFAEFYTRTRGQIDTLVQTDPNAFYSYEEYESAAEMLWQTVQLRGQSINGQLDGSIPSTDEAQQQDQTALLDASSITLETMGSMGDLGNMGGPGGPGGPDGNDGPPQIAEAGAFNPARSAEGSRKTNEDNGQGMQGFPGIPEIGSGQEMLSTRDALIVDGVSIAILLIALLLAACYRRKSYKL